MSGVLAMLASEGSAFQKLRVATPTNMFAASSPVTSAGTQLNVRGRSYFFIGSGDMSRLRLSFTSWLLAAANITLYTDDYTIVKVTIEKDGATSLANTCQVTFGTLSGTPGSRTALITAGSTDQQSDDILPSAFGLTKFTVGDKYWIRSEVSVASAGLHLPKGPILNTLGGEISGTIDPATFVGGAVDSWGAMAFTSGFGSYQSLYVPIVLGSFVTGDPPTYLACGDSLVVGQNDTFGLLQGGIQRAWFDSNGTSNPLGGLKAALGGSTADMWNVTNSTKPQAYMKYAKYLVEEFGANEYLTSPGTAVATAMAKSSVIYTKWLASESKVTGSILRSKLTPRANSTQSISTLTSASTTVTVTIGSGTLPPNGASITISGCTPAAYNGTFTITSAAGSVFTYTAGSAPGTATVLGTWSDQWATAANQSGLNAAWNASGNARAFNANLDTNQVTLGIGQIIPLTSVRQGSTEGTDAFYQWLSNGTANSIINENTHPLAAGYILEAAEYRTFFSGLT